MFDLKKFADAVRAHRGERTLKEAAEETGLSQTAIMRIETGTVTPTAPTLATLCAWMGVSMDSFTTEVAA